MILYFSGTGNSEYAAKRIGKTVNDQTINLFSKIRDCDFSQLHSEQPWIVVAPTYAWRLPRLVQAWLKNTTLSGNKQIYFVLTCGDSIGNAGAYLKRLCDEKGMDYCGCAGVVMPENYIALFTTPTQEQALRIIARAQRSIDRIALRIQNGERFPQARVKLLDRINSGMVNRMFYPVCVHAKKFSVSAQCVSCGQCAAVCPLKNIRIENGRPVWGDDCTHCMACICRCPAEAIEYGKHSRGLPRYTFPKQD